MLERPDLFMQGQDVKNKFTDIDGKIGNLQKDLDTRTINVMYPPPPLVGAKGDGITDDTVAIQKIVDYVVSLGGGTIEVPSNGKVFKVTEDVRIQGVDGDRKGNIVIQGMGDSSARFQRTSIAGSESAIFRIVSSGRNIKINNVYLSGDANTKYGIYADVSVNISSFRNFTIRNVQNGIMLNVGAWLSTFENFDIRGVVNGWWNNGHSTSLFVKNGYVVQASGHAYHFNGAYSTFVNLACDGCTGTPYYFTYAEGCTLTSVGCEGGVVDNVIWAEYSNLVIDNLRIYEVTVNNSLVYNRSDSTIIIEGLSINNTEGLTPKVFDFGYGLNSVTEIKNLINKDKTTTFLNTTDISTYASRGSRPIGKIGSTVLKFYNNTGDSLKRDFMYYEPEGLSNGSIGYCDDKPKTANGKDWTYHPAEKKGSVFIRKNMNNGIFAYVRSDSTEGATYGTASYMKVPYIMSSTTSARPTTDLEVGQCVFDTTLSKPIWWSGTVWKDATGTTV